jgi:hypothetical protein
MPRAQRLAAVKSRVTGDRQGHRVRPHRIVGFGATIVASAYSVSTTHGKWFEEVFTSWLKPGLPTSWSGSMRPAN